MNKVFALPTPQTVAFFNEIFQGAPILLDPETFGVELGSTEGPVTVADPTRTYRALPGLMDVWYETASARSYWILPLIPSPEMCARHDQVGDAWGRVFVPFIRIAEVQNMQHRKVAWMKSIATSLVSTKPILSFYNELVISDAAAIPTQHDFYEDYVARGGMSGSFPEAFDAAD